MRIYGDKVVVRPSAKKSKHQAASVLDHAARLTVKD